MECILYHLWFCRADSRMVDGYFYAINYLFFTSVASLASHTRSNNELHFCKKRYRYYYVVNQTRTDMKQKDTKNIPSESRRATEDDLS